MTDPLTPVIPGADDQPAAASQQSAAGASDEAKHEQQDQSTERTFSKAEFDEVVSQRQAVKESLRQTQTRLEDIQGKLSGIPSADDLRAFNEWKATQDKAATDKAIAAGDIASIEAKLREPLEARIAALTDGNVALKGQLTGVLRDSALKAAAAAANALNPTHVVTMLQPRVRMVESADGHFVPDFRDADDQPIYNGDGQRVTDMQEFVNRFLSHPDNAYLVRSNVAPGSGAKPAGGGTQSASTVTMQSLQNMTPAQREEKLASMTDAEVAAMAPDRRGRLAGGNFV